MFQILALDSILCQPTPFAPLPVKEIAEVAVPSECPLREPVSMSIESIYKNHISLTSLLLLETADRQQTSASVIRVNFRLLDRNRTRLFGLNITASASETQPPWFHDLKS